MRYAIIIGDAETAKLVQEYNGLNGLELIPVSSLEEALEKNLSTFIVEDQRASLENVATMLAALSKAEVNALEADHDELRFRKEQNKYRSRYHSRKKF